MAYMDMLALDLDSEAEESSSSEESFILKDLLTLLVTNLSDGSFYSSLFKLDRRSRCSR